MYALAKLLRAQERLVEAEPLYRETLLSTQATQGEDHPESLLDAHNLATLLHQMGRNDEAEALLRETVTRCERVHGPDHAQTSVNRTSLCAVLIGRSRASANAATPESIKAADDALVEAMTLRDLLAADNAVTLAPDFRAALDDMIDAYERMGRTADAELWRVERDAP